ncbi:MAG: hypothetical protein FGM14_14070 [Flavobacteriales bacterium]|nr:hypothetical protein [Flavobacteriales bacterium]
MIEQTPIYQLLLRTRALKNSVAWYDAFRNSSNLKGQILDWIRNDQLRENGIDEFGNVIGYYSSLTSQINPKKKFNTHYTLEDTGDFYKSMFIRVFYDAITINANADKMEDKEWWSNSILGLTDENLSKFVDKLRDQYILYARRILFNY